MLLNWFCIEEGADGQVPNTDLAGAAQILDDVKSPTVIAAKCTVVRLAANQDVASNAVRPTRRHQQTLRGRSHIASGNQPSLSCRKQRSAPWPYSYWPYR